MRFTGLFSKHLAAIIASMAGGAIAGGGIVLALGAVPHSAPVGAPVAQVTSPSPSDLPTPTPDQTPTPEPTTAPAPTAAPVPPARPAPTQAPAPATAAPTAEPTPPPPPPPAYVGASVSAVKGASPLNVTWHVDVTGTAPFSIRWTINSHAYTTTAPDLPQTLGPGTWYLTCVQITDANARTSLVVLVDGPRVVVDEQATSVTGGCA